MIRVLPKMVPNSSELFGKSGTREASLNNSCSGFDGSTIVFEGGLLSFKRASNGLQTGFKRASNGLQTGFKLELLGVGGGKKVHEFSRHGGRPG